MQPIHNELDDQIVYFRLSQLTPGRAKQFRLAHFVSRGVGLSLDCLFSPPFFVLIEPS